MSFGGPEALVRLYRTQVKQLTLERDGLKANLAEAFRELERLNQALARWKSETSPSLADVLLELWTTQDLLWSTQDLLAHAKRTIAELDELVAGCEAPSTPQSRRMPGPRSWQP
jgi:hypothetical protein